MQFSCTCNHVTSLSLKVLTILSVGLTSYPLHGFFCYEFRYVVIDLSAGPCTYGKIETEEGSVSSKTLPRLRNVIIPRGSGAVSDPSSHNIFVGQLAALVATTAEHVIAPDVRYTTATLFPDIKVTVC